MLDAVRNLHALGVPLEDALGRRQRCPRGSRGGPTSGGLRPGAPADIVVLDDRLDVIRVLVGGGECVARA